MRRFRGYRKKVDISTSPLEFAVNNQHMNGGIRVDTWGRTNISGIYAAGEAAGTHGATRPGGSALNAGQVFATRVAEHIAAGGKADTRSKADAIDQIIAAVNTVESILNVHCNQSVQDIRSEVQARMSDFERWRQSRSQGNL